MVSNIVYHQGEILDIYVCRRHGGAKWTVRIQIRYKPQLAGIADSPVNSVLSGLSFKRLRSSPRPNHSQIWGSLSDHLYPSHFNPDLQPRLTLSPLDTPEEVIRLSLAILPDPMMSGPDIRAVQEALIRALPQDQLAADGWYGPRTEGVVRRFQAIEGLQVDGIVGPHTWQALFAPAQEAA